MRVEKQPVGIQDRYATTADRSLGRRLTIVVVI